MSHKGTLAAAWPGMCTTLRFPTSALLLSAALTLAACGGGAASPEEGPGSMQAPSSTPPSGDKGAAGSAPGRPGAGMTSATSVAKPSDGMAGSMAAMAGVAKPSGGMAGTSASSTAGSSSASPSSTAGSGSSATAGSSSTSSAGGGAATASAGTGAAGASGAAAMSGKPAATSYDFAITQEKVSDQPVFNVTHPENLDAPGFLLPVIVWANGGCFRSDFTWKPLFDRWAKAGFVVLSLTGTGDENDIASMLSTTTKTEHAALIDWVFKQNETGKYAGKLDLKRIIVAGNSCGGVTALEVAADEDRLAAVFVLSGSSAVGSVNAQVMKSINIPVGYIVGGSEDVAGANATGDYEAMNDGVPAMIVNRKEGDHQTVSTDPMIAPEVAEIALNWMDLAVNGTQAAYDALTSPDVCEHCTPGDWKLTQKGIEKLQK